MPADENKEKLSIFFLGLSPQSYGSLRLIENRLIGLFLLLENSHEGWGGGRGSRHATSACDFWALEEMGGLVDRITHEIKEREHTRYTT